jgi:hypothetical protein
MPVTLDHIALPESVVDALEQVKQEREADREAKVQKLAETLLANRKRAIEGREQSGIEDIWRYCEEAYIGMDNANRHEFHSNRWMKPMTPDGPVDKDSKKSDDTKSSLYTPFTRRYVNAGVSKVQEILLAPDEKPFSAMPTPIPELAQQLKDTRQMEHNGTLLERDPTPKEVNPGSGGTPEHPLPLMDAPATDTSQAPGKPLTYAERAAERMEKAVEAAEAVTRRIHDSMVECRFAMHDRRCIQDGGRIGTGIVKGPFPEISRTVVAYKKMLPNPHTGVEEEAEVIEIKESIIPAAKRVSPWNFYPDPGCGEDIQEGGHVWERDDLSRGSLQKLAKQAGYNKRAIAKILAEPPQRVVDTKKHEHMNQDAVAQLAYEAWFFYATVTQDEYRIMQEGMNQPDLDGLDELEDVYVQGTIVNDQIIQLVRQPNEKTGKFPYHIFNWLHREGFWAGIGIAEQGMPAQRLINGAVRRLIDNAGFSAGMQLFLDDDLIEPAPVDGETNNYKIQAVKVWRKKAGAMIDDMRKAMHVVKFPNAQAQLSWLIEFGIRLYEETTNIPLVTQGWSGKTTPETLGGQELQDSNANQMLRDVAMNHDHGIIVPFVLQRHEWHLLDDTVPFEEKGDVKIHARGSTAMLDRYLQRQVYEKHLPMLLQGSRMFRVDPEKLIDEVWRGYRLNLKAIQFSDAKWKELSNQPPPEDPQVTAAKVKAELEAKRIEMTHDYNMKELELRREIAQLGYQEKLLDYATRKEISLEQAKKDLAKTSMELATQKELFFHGKGAAPQVTEPSLEPVGRAPEGEAFQK